MKSFFISSTFKDMQAERDLMHQSIFPDLRRELKKYNEDIQELDLRWGVDTSLMTEEESGQHVIATCIDSIDRCRPYMIILIGERYGWIPDSNLVKSSHDQRLIDCYEELISITQMEIMYGALSQETLSRCIFCFRNEQFSQNIPENHRSFYQSESLHHAEKLRLLKEKIRSTPGAKIIEYTPVWDETNQTVSGLESFSTHLYESLWEMMESELEDKSFISPEERILLQSQSTAERYLASYIPRNDTNIATSTTGRSAVLYYGTGGCGKSAFLSSIWQGCNFTGIHTFLYYCGNENCGNSDTFLNTLFYWLKTEASEPFTDADRNLHRSKKIAQILALLKRPRSCDCMLLIDAIDQMEDDLLPVLLQISEAIIRSTVEKYTFGLVTTALDSYYHKHSFHIRQADFNARKLDEMSENEVIAISQLHAKNRGKHLDIRAQQAIRNKKSSKNPYYLTLLLQQLFMMDNDDFQKAEALAPGMEGLSLYMDQLIQNMPDDIGEMTLHTLQFSIEKMKKFQKNWNLMEPMELLSLIAVSKNGLTLEEMESLLLPMDIHRLFTLLYDAFQESNTGRWDFSHRLLRESLLSHIGKDELKNASLLLANLTKKEKKYSDSFYYALYSEHPEVIRNSLSDISTLQPEQQEIFFLIYRDYLLKTRKHLDFKAMNLGEDFYAWFLSRTILCDPESLIPEQKFWLDLVESADTDALTSKTRFYLTLAHLYLLQYEEFTDAYESAFTECKNLFRSLDKPEKEDIYAYTSLLLMIRFDFHQSRLENEAETELSFVLYSPEYSNCLKKYKGILTLLLHVLTTWKTINTEEEIEKFVKTIDALDKSFDISLYRELPEFEKRIHRIFMRMLLEASKKYFYLGKHKSVLMTCSLLNDWISLCLTDTMSINDRRLYIFYLRCQIYSTVCDYAIKKVNLLQKQCEFLANYAPIPYFKRLYADTHSTRISILHELKKEKKYDFEIENDYNLTIKKGIELYEELLAGKSGEEKEDFIIEEYNFLMYLYITQKMEENISKWPSAETDLEAALEHRILLYKKVNNYDNLFGIGWSYYYLLQYFDRIQNVEKLNALAERFLQFMKELEVLDTKNTKNYTKLKFYLEMAEALARFDCLEKLPFLLEKCSSIVTCLLEKSEKNVERLKTYQVRMATLRLKCHLFTDSEEADTIFQNGVTKALAFTDEDLKLLSDLYQTMGELAFASGDKDKAMELLEKSKIGFAKPGSISARDNEERNQKSFRFYQGQLLLSRLTMDKELLLKSCKYYKWLLADYTKDKDILNRPLLQEAAKTAKNIYDTCFPEEPVCEQLQYLLLGNEPARKAYYWNIYLAEESEAFKSLTDWEAEHPDTYDQTHLSLIKNVGKIQDKLVDQMIKNSIGHKELWSRQMELMKKYITHYLGNKDYYKMFSCVSTFARQIDYRKEWADEYYPAEFCMDYFKKLIPIREIAPYKNRSMQVDWLVTIHFGTKCCNRMYAKTRDISWIHQAIQILSGHRTYMSSFLKEIPEDKDWLIENISEIHSDEQNYYILLMQSNCVPEQEWVPAFLESVDNQLKLPLSLRDAVYRDVLDRLYQLQVKDASYQISIQKHIDLVTAAQKTNDRNFFFYIQKAAKDLPSDATVEQLTAYVQKLKEGETS